MSNTNFKNSRQMVPDRWKSFNYVLDDSIFEKHAMYYSLSDSFPSFCYKNARVNCFIFDNVHGLH